MHKVFDGLVNLVSSIGTAKDKAAQYRSHYQPIGRDEIEALYLGDWLGRKIIDTIPGDMVREWRIWETRDAGALVDAEAALGVRSHVHRALVWASLYGGSAILIGDGTPDPRLPFDPTLLGKGGIKYLHTFNRWELRRGDINRDVLSPDFGRPETFWLQAQNSDREVEIHRSRFVMFDGMDAPRQFRDINEGWGLSRFDHIRQAIVNVGGSAANAAALVEESKLDVVTIPDLATYMQTSQGEAAVIKRFAAAMQLKSTVNTLLLGTGEEFQRKQVSFTGLPDLIRVHIDMVAGASDIPVTRLLGISPKGLSGKGDHETRNYYDFVRAKQTNELGPALKVLDQALIRHTYANIPRNLTYSWAPLWQMNADEKVTVEKTQADTDAVYAGMGIFPAAGLAKVIRDRLVANKTYTTLEQNVTDEALNKLGDAPLKAAPPKPKDANPLETRGADAAPRSLYVSRKVVNGEAIVAWARRQGFATPLAAEDMHITIAYSRAAVDWMAAGEAWSSEMKIGAGGPRLLERFGDAVVLLVKASELEWRHRSFEEIGASWDHPEYQPHVTIAYGADVDLASVEPYQGEIVLGPEIFAEVDENWKAKVAA